MDNAQLTNVLMTGILAMIGFVSNIFIKKMDRFEKKMEEILMSNVGINKDIDVMKKDVDNHEVRITHLETK